MAKSVDEMSEAELDAILAQQQPKTKSVDEMSEAELDAILAQNSDPSTKQAQRELINERVAKEKAAINQRYEDEMTTGDKIGAGAGALMINAGRMANWATPLVEKAFPGSAVDASKEAQETEEQMPMISAIGKGIGIVGSALAPAGLAKAGATLPSTVGQSALRAGGTNAAISGGITALNEAPDVIRGEESLGSAATDVATSALVGGALGAGGQALSNKLASSASKDIQDAAARTVQSLTPQKRADFVQAASKFGVDPQALSDDIITLEKGGELSKNSALANFYTIAKNKVFDGVKTAQDADVNLRRLADTGADDIARGISQIPEGYKADLNMDEVLSDLIGQRTGKNSMAATGAEYLDEFKSALDKIGLPARAKQVLTAEGRQRLTPQEVQDLQRVLQNKLSDFYKLSKDEVLKSKEGLQLLADVRNRLAGILEDVGGPGVREGNEKVHAALMMRNALKFSDKAFDKEGLMQAGWRRITGSLTPIGVKLAPLRAVLDTARQSTPIPELVARPEPTRLARSLQSVTGFLNQPQVIQNLAPQDAAIVKQFLNLPPEKQEQMAPVAMQVIEKTGAATFDPPKSGYASEVNGKLTSPADILDYGEKLMKRKDLSILEKTKAWNEVNDKGTILNEGIFTNPEMPGVEVEFNKDFVRTSVPNPDQKYTVEEAMNRVTKPKRRY